MNFLFFVGFSFISTNILALPLMEDPFFCVSYQKKYDKDNNLKIKITQGDYTLKLVKPKDKRFLEALHTDPRAMKTFMYNGEARSSASFSQLFQQWCLKVQQDIPFTAYTFWNNKSKKFIGYIGFDHYSPHSLEVCYAVVPECWNQGFGSTILKTGCHFLMDLLNQHGYLKKYNINSIIAHVSNQNGASSGILKKNGFQPIEKTKEDTSPNHWIKVEKTL